MDHRPRRDRVRARLREEGLDALWVTHPPNVRWLTGFTGSSGEALVVADPDGDALLTDGRYEEQAAGEAADLERVIARSGRAERGVELAAAGGATAIGFEAERIDWRGGTELIDVAEGHGLGARPTTAIVERLRATKDDDEVALLRRACTVTAEAFDDALGWLTPGLSEREVAVRLERTMVDLGAEVAAFPTIVASGPNSARPHHRPTGRRLARGDLVKIDLGARVGGYHADMTRTIALGAVPAELRAVHDLVRAAQGRGIEAAVAGVSAGEVDAACRERIAAAGHGERFVHGTGHGVGLEVHEWPVLSRGARATLAAGTTVTVEPGVYLPGVGGVRIEDTVVVRADHPPEVLTRSHRDLIVL